MTLDKTSKLLICALGNPGTYYKNHRHSIALRILDILQRDYLHYPMWEKDGKCHGFWSNTSGNCVLFKSNTYMNNSGRSVSRAYIKMGGKDWGKLLVLHDDLESAIGKVKLRISGTGNGHNGIRSCVQALRTEEFLRLAIGIGRPESREPEIISQYVLEDIPPIELDIIRQKAIPTVLMHIQNLVNVE